MQGTFLFIYSSWGVQNYMLLCIHLVLVEIFSSKQEKSWTLCFCSLRRCLAGNDGNTRARLEHSEVIASKCFTMYCKGTQNMRFHFRLALCDLLNLDILLADNLVSLLYALCIELIKLTHNREAVSSIHTYPCSTLSVLRISFTTYTALRNIRSG